jgi:proteic killer suppression protein
VFLGEPTRKFPQEIQRGAIPKLQQLDGATALTDLREPPGNRFEALRGGRQGEYSIRINDQWRVVFRWDNEPYDVKIEDYH